MNYSPALKGMNYSSMLKGILVLLILFSLGWKSAVHRDYSSNLEDKIRSFLTTNQFNFAVSEEMIRDKRTFRATKPACRMLVTEISPRGWERDTINKSATTVDQVFIVFGGRIYPEQPIWLTAADFLRYKVLSELGSKLRPTPVIAVIATKTCDAERLPWHELGSAEPKSQ